MSEIIGRYAEEDHDARDVANELEAAGAEVFSIMFDSKRGTYCVWAKIKIVDKYPDEYLRNEEYKKDLITAIAKVQPKDEIS
jgi:hypothetical protein